MSHLKRRTFLAAEPATVSGLDAYFAKGNSAAVDEP